MKLFKRFIIPYKDTQILTVLKNQEIQIHVQKSVQDDHKTANRDKKNIQVSSLDRDKQDEKDRGKSKRASERKHSASPRATSSKSALYKIWIEQSTYNKIISDNKSKFQSLVQDHDLHHIDTYSKNAKIAVSDNVQKTTARYIYEDVPTISSKTFLKIKNRQELMGIMHLEEEYERKFLKPLSGKSFAFTKHIPKGLSSQLKTLIEKHSGQIVSQDEIDTENKSHFILIDQRQFNDKFEKQDNQYHYSIIYRLIGAGGYLQNLEAYHYIDHFNKLSTFMDDHALIQKLGLLKKRVSHQISIEKIKGSKDLIKALNLISKKGKYKMTKDQMEADFVLCNDLQKAKNDYDDDDDKKEEDQMSGDGEYLHVTWLLESCICDHALRHDEYQMKKHGGKKQKSIRGANKRVHGDEDDDE